MQTSIVKRDIKPEHKRVYIPLAERLKDCSGQPYGMTDEGWYKSPITTTRLAGGLLSAYKAVVTGSVY